MRKWNDDPYTKKARNENYEARSVYKLIEIDKKFRIFRGCKRVLDLGASPGSWTQLAVERLPLDGSIVAVDVNPMEFAHPKVEFIQQSVLEWNPNESMNTTFDLLLSDMAPKTTGIHDLDVAQSVELCETALRLFVRLGKPKSVCVLKIFMGEGFEGFRKNLKQYFEKVDLFKPQSTRKQSREIFIIGLSRK